jgi:hypothetical protein
MTDEGLIIEGPMIFIAGIICHFEKFVYDFPFDFNEVFYCSILLRDDYPLPYIKPEFLASGFL